MTYYDQENQFLRQQLQKEIQGDHGGNLRQRNPVAVLKSYKKQGDINPDHGLGHIGDIAGVSG